MAVVLILLVICGYILQNQVSTKISEIDGVDVADVDCSLIQNTVDLKKLNIDFAVLPVFQGQANAIEISGVNRIQYLLTGGFEIEEVVVESGEFYLDLSQPKRSVSSDSSTMPNLHIDELILRNAKIHILQDSVEIALIEDVAFRLYDLDFNPDSSFFWKDYFLSTGLITYKIPNIYHQISIGHAFYDPEVDRIELNDVRFYSDVSINNWFETVKQKQSRYDFKGEKIEIISPNIKGLMNKKQLDIDKVVVHDGSLEIYEDQSFNHCATCKKKLPHQMLLAAKQTISIDSVQFKNGHIRYLSREVSKKELGSLAFSNFYASFYHLSNKAEDIRKQPAVIVDAQAAIFETTPIALHLELDLSNKKGGYAYSGTVGGFDLLRLNDFLGPVMNVVVASGKSANSTFYVKTKNRIATGEMMFPYQELKVKFLNEDKDSKRLISGLLNGLAIKNDNIADKKMRMGVIYHEEDPSRSFFHSLSQSLQSGIQSSAIANYLLPDELRSIERKK